MANITLSIPEDLKKRMDAMPEIKWSEILRNIIIKKVRQLKKFEGMVERGEI